MTERETAVEVEADELRRRQERALELLDARLDRTPNASGFLRRLRDVLRGVRS